MKHARPLLLAVSTLALLVSACSQPLDTGTPELSPQFGTLRDDYVNVADVHTDGVYLGGLWDGESALIKYTREGRLPRVAFPKIRPGERGMGMSAYDGGMVGVEVAADGYVHVLQNVYGYASTGEYYQAHYLRKYNPMGGLVWQRRFNDGSADDATLALDGKGNIYIFKRSDDRVLSLYKHNAKGEPLWRKVLSDTLHYSSVVASDGSVYLAYLGTRESQIMKYDAAGRTVWTRTVPFSADRLAIGQSSTLYVAGGYYVEDEVTGPRPVGIKLVKLTSTGRTSWIKAVAKGQGGYFADLGADTQDGVYIGLLDYKEGPESMVLLKYGPNAAQQWSRTFELRDGAAFNDVAVLSASEIYLSGAVPEKGRPGVQNGFLLRLNGQGNKVWQR